MTSAPGLHIRGGATMNGRPFFRNLDLSLEAGKWTCLLGASGVGKSTILRLIAGLETHVEFEGSISATDGIPPEGRVAYMAQQHLLFPWNNILENVATGARLRNERVDRERSRDILARVGLQDHAEKRPAALSGGEKQRAALARTLMEDRPIILLDEPFSALDARTRSEMQDLAARLLSGRTVFMVTHDPLEAARLGHTINVMRHDGTIAIPAPLSQPPRAIDDPGMLTLQGTLYRQLMAAA